MYLHFYRISPNWRVLGEKLSCCPEWNILILWPSGKHTKVIMHAALPFKTYYQIIFGWLFGLQNRCDCVCSADDLLCIVMEYCSGGDLLQRIRGQKSTQFCVDNVGVAATLYVWMFCLIEIYLFFISFHRSWSGLLKCVQEQSIFMISMFCTEIWNPRYSMAWGVMIYGVYVIRIIIFSF